MRCETAGQWTDWQRRKRTSPGPPEVPRPKLSINLRRPSLHHAAGREREGSGKGSPRSPRPRDQRPFTAGKAVRILDYMVTPDQPWLLSRWAHAQGSGRHPRPCRRAGPGPLPTAALHMGGPPLASSEHAQLAHDTAIYRACGRERQRLLEPGRRHTARTARRRASRALSLAARGSESARARDRRRAADAERPLPRCPGAGAPHRRAGTRALPRCADRVHRRRWAERPSECRGRIGALPSWIRPGQLCRRGTTAAAGFRMHANEPAGARVLRALGYGDDHGSIRGPAERNPAALEL